MKKFALLITGILMILNTSAQSFHRRAFVIDFGIGANITKIATSQEYNAQIGNGNNKHTIRIKKDTTDNSAAIVFPLTLEYGLKNWLGLTCRATYTKYFAGKDSLTGIKPDVRGIDGGLGLNLHIFKTKRFDMPIGVTLGYSNFQSLSNDTLNSVAKDHGFNYGFSIVPRIYFAGHIGLSINLGYMAYTYPSILFSNKNDSNINDNNNRVFKLKESGANIGVGLVIKI